MTLTGVVMDQNNEPIIGATIMVIGTTNGTTTDIDGRYSLRGVPANGTIEVQYLGMKTQTIELNGKNVVNVFMEDETIGIEEVVVVGYGTQKESKLDGCRLQCEDRRATQQPFVGQRVIGVAR